MAQPVAIVGAGIAGLTLGRALRQKGIPAVLFDRAPSARRHSYGITLYSWAYKALVKVLDVDDTTFRRRVAVDASQGGLGRVYPESYRPVTRGPRNERTDSTAFRANRVRLESWLGEGLNIKRGHDLQHVEVSSDGVRLSFSGGQSLEAVLVIGADGAHSKMRSVLSSTSQPEIHPFVVFNGRRKVALERFRTVYAPYFGDANVIEMHTGKARLQISLDDYTDRSVSVSYTYSRAARSNDPLHRPDRAPSAASKTPEEFYAELESLRDLQAPFAEVFGAKSVRRDRVLHWLMRSFEMSEEETCSLAKQGVVLIGDAAHATPILGGGGANTAIYDGIAAANAIYRHQPGNHWGRSQEMPHFVRDNYKWWSDRVHRGRVNLEALHPKEE